MLLNTSPDYTPKNFWWRHTRSVLLGIDVLINAILGGNAYQTLSCRIGISIINEGWASKVKWPSALYNHFVSAVYNTTV